MAAAVPGQLPAIRWPRLVTDAALRGSQLQPNATAQAVRGGTVTTGPMVATTPALSGYVVEATDLDAAVEIAKQVPSKFGGVEVRPLFTGQG